MQSGVVTSLYLICCILRILKIKDLANTMAAALLYPLEAFAKSYRGKVNGHLFDRGFTSESQESDDGSLTNSDARYSMDSTPCSSSSSGFHPEHVITQNNCSDSNLAVR